MKKLRLVLFEKCNRSCAGCCNQDHNISGLPKVETYVGYRKIILTGGEPMLNPQLVLDTIEDIRKVNGCPIIMYTTKSKRPEDLIMMLDVLDGITLTLHEQYDVEPFIRLNDMLLQARRIKEANGLVIRKSLRLNVFAPIDVSGIDTSLWRVKDNIEWIENCPLPIGEDLRIL